MVRKLLTGFSLLLTCPCLLSCSGGSGGAESPLVRGPADFRGLDAFERRFQEIDRLDLTRDMPRSGTARYTGLTSAELYRGAARAGEVTGEVEMTFDFAAAASRATEDKAVSGRMHNFRGTLDGSEVSFAGQLTTSAAKDMGLESRARVADLITGSSGPEGPGRTGSFLAQFVGELSTGAVGGEVQLTASGDFRGAAGAGATGTLSGLWWDPAAADPLSANGRFVVTRD